MKKKLLILEILLLLFLAIFNYLNKEAINVTYVNKVFIKKVALQNKKQEQILETFYGNVSAYLPTCSGCSGITASGIDVKNNIYYNDSTYGKINIVAADKKYPFGTIIRFKNFYNYLDTIAIVLDRGGAISNNKKIQFDLLFDNLSGALKFGIQQNVKFEILRLGF